MKKINVKHSFKNLCIFSDDASEEDLKAEVSYYLLLLSREFSSLESNKALSICYLKFLL